MVYSYIAMPISKIVVSNRVGLYLNYDFTPHKSEQITTEAGTNQTLLWDSAILTHSWNLCEWERKGKAHRNIWLSLYVLSEEEPRKLTLILWLELSTPICKERTFCFAPSLDEKWIMLLSHFQTPISQLFASFLSLKSFFFQISITSSFSLVLCSLSFTVSLFHSSTLFRWLHLSLSHSSALLTSR